VLIVGGTFPNFDLLCERLETAGTRIILPTWVSSHHCFVKELIAFIFIVVA